ncbi:putative serine/threonine-protein kinase iks1 [Lobulomyces angularis]|nr:putative serine/threonine-protein kinase iks1 [Lobulomyces angularis]
MSIIPFDNNWQVVLHNKGEVVLYNQIENSLLIKRVRSTNSNFTENPSPASGFNSICSQCGQTIPNPHHEANQSNSGSANSFFADRNYFLLLEGANSALNTAESRTTSNPNFSCSKNISITPISTSPKISEFVTVDEFFQETNLLNQGEGTSIDENIPIPIPIQSGFSNKTLNPGYYERFFIEKVKLGKGFRVFCCLHVLNGIVLGEFAIKKVPVGESKDWLVKMLREVKLLEKLRHPNIIEYKHAWVEDYQLTKFGPEIPTLFILMEQANGGNLEEFVELQWKGDTDDSNIIFKKFRGKNNAKGVYPNSASMGRLGGIGYQNVGSLKKVRYLNESEIFSFFLDICKGLVHLHEHGIIHRDLKPNNLLLHYDNDNRELIPKLLISDFGECAILNDIKNRSKNNFGEGLEDRSGTTGTLEFQAPELLIKTNMKYLNLHNASTDIWSLGMILYYLSFSRVPYTQVEDVDILYKEILEFRLDEFPSHCYSRVPNIILDLIKVCLSPNARDRPTAKNILEKFS